MLGQKATEDRDIVLLLYDNIKDNAFFSKGPEGLHSQSPTCSEGSCARVALRLPAASLGGSRSGDRRTWAFWGPSTHSTTTLSLSAASSELPQQIPCHVAEPHLEAADHGGHQAA